MENKFENNINTGRLFEENQVTVVKKGTIKVPMENKLHEAVRVIESLLNQDVRSEDRELARNFVAQNRIDIDEGKDRYFSILRFQFPNSEEVKYELAMSVGRLYINHDKNDPETSPDLTGPITIDDIIYKFGGWKKLTSTGKNFTRVSLKKSEPKEDNVSTPAISSGTPFPSEPMINTIDDEDIPF